MTRYQNFNCSIYTLGDIAISSSIGGHLGFFKFWHPKSYQIFVHSDQNSLLTYYLVEKLKKQAFTRTCNDCYTFAPTKRV